MRTALLFLLMPMLAWGSDLAYTNSLTHDPYDSDGDYSDFQWRWSAYDDQRVELFFKSVPVTNVGFRLAYPQRGQIYLDVLPPQVTNVAAAFITNITLDVQTTAYPTVYNQTFTPASSNVIVRVNYSNGVFISSDPIVNNPGSPTTPSSSITGTNTASTVIWTQSAVFARSPDIGAYTNTYIAVTNTVVYQTNRLEWTGTTKYTKDATNDFWSIPGQAQSVFVTRSGPPEVIDGQYTSDGGGLTNLVATTNTYLFTNTFALGYNAGNATSEHFLLRFQPNVTISVKTNDLVVSSPLKLTYSIVEDNPGQCMSTNTNTWVIGNAEVDISNPTIRTTTGSGTDFFYFYSGSPDAGSTIITFTNNCTNLVTYGLQVKVVSPNTNYGYSFYASSQNPLSLQRLTNTTVDPRITSGTNFPVTAGSNVVKYIVPGADRASSIYRVDVEQVQAKTVFNLSRTNLPPEGTYFGEFLSYGTSATNPTPSRTVARGVVTVEHSIWGITNYAGWTNTSTYLPSDYYVLDGTRALAGNMNAGGYSITNIGNLVGNGAGLTNIAGSSVSGVLTSAVVGAGSSSRLTITNGGGPQVTFNLDVTGLATGTPLYTAEGATSFVAKVGDTMTGALTATVLHATSFLNISGTTNQYTDDGSSLLRNGVSIQGSVSNLNSLSDVIDSGGTTTNMLWWQGTTWSNIELEVWSGSVVEATHWNYAAKSANYTSVNYDALGVSGNSTITLFAADTAGSKVRIKKTDTAGTTVVIVPPAGDLIDGGTSASLVTQYEAIELLSAGDGTNWFVW